MKVQKILLFRTFAKVFCGVLASSTLTTPCLAVVFGPTSILQREVTQKPMALWAHTEEFAGQKAVCFYETPYEALPANARTSLTQHFFEQASSHSQPLMSHFINVNEVDSRLYKYSKNLEKEFNQRLEFGGVHWNHLTERSKLTLIASCGIGGLVATNVGIAALGPLVVCPALMAAGGIYLWSSHTLEFKEFLDTTTPLNHSQFLLSDNILTNPYGYRLVKKGLEILNIIFSPKLTDLPLCPPPSSLFQGGTGDL